MVLTARDHEILRQVYEYRMLTREQVETLLFPPDKGQDHFTKTSKARKRLKLLFHHGYLQRIPMPVGSGAWAWRPMYRLARKGAQVVAEDLEIPLNRLMYWGKADDREHRHSQVSHLFLEHALQINDVRIAFTLAAQREGYQIEKWLDDAALKSQELKDTVVVSHGGQTRQYPVLPDAFFILSLGTRRAPLFLELDRATMTQQRWGTRVLTYLTYVRSGKYTARYQTRSLRILTVTTTEQRMQNLMATTHKAGGGSLFWFTTLDQVSAASVLYRPIWLLANDARGDEGANSARKSLLG